MTKFSSYWPGLVDRVYHHGENLVGVEELVYRLTCIYGETMVDGIEAYFERRGDEYDRDQEVLREQGFAGIAEDFAEARRVLFGDVPLSEEPIAPLLDRYYEEDEAAGVIRQGLGPVYDRLIDTLEALIDRRDEIGVENDLFEPEDGEGD